MLDADPGIRLDAHQKLGALDGDGVVDPLSTRRPIKLCSTADVARPRRPFVKERRLSERSRDPLRVFASSELQETADAVRDTVTPDAPATVSSVPYGDGVVLLLSTRRLNKRDSTEEDAERLLREVSEEDDMSRESSREWLSDSEKVENTLPNTSS